MWAQPLAVNAKALKFGKGVGELRGIGGGGGGDSLSLSSHFLALLFFPLICQRERKRHFYKQQASIFQYADDGSLVLIICGILLRDVGLSQVAAYMPGALCCTILRCSFIKATSLRRLKMECLFRIPSHLEQAFVPFCDFWLMYIVTALCINFMWSL